MEHVMIDLETLGRRAGCSILSIGAVAFDTTGLGPEFYTVVDRASCQAHGLHEDENTVAWWNKQSAQAQTVLEQAATNGQPLADALAELTTFLGGLGSLKKLKVWGNGADFDNAILTACYAAVGRELPWDFWNNRCYRTIKGLRPQVKLARQGTYHNALDDAKSQATHAVQLLELLRG